LTVARVSPHVPKETADLSRELLDPTVFGIDVAAQPQADPIVLDFPISLTL